MDMKMIYHQPARRWEETLPIGNGSLGAMIWGNVGEECLGLNLDTLWSGYERDKNNPGALPYLSLVRRLISQGRYEEAEAMVEEHMLGEYNESYLPLGKLLIRNHSDGRGAADQEEADGSVRNYKRELDLEHAVARISFEDEKGGYHVREYIASYPDQAVIGHYRWSPAALDTQTVTGEKQDSQCGEEGRGMNLAFCFRSELNCHVTGEGESLTVQGQCPEHVDPAHIRDGAFPVIQGTRGMRFGARLMILDCDGRVTVEEDRLAVSGAREVTFAFAAVCPGTQVGRELKKEHSWESILQRHVRDYGSLYGTVSLYLGEQKDMPTDKRLEALRQGAEDAGLYALYFQYGRYLLISSSREGSQPANLQGIWSWEFRAPWNSNWTTNINTQMNYWPVDSCNLSPCFGPYIEFVKRICENGKKTAQTHYGCRGFVHHHNADYWCSTNPVGMAYGETKGRRGAAVWSMWPMGGVWLCQELFRHYEYHPDPDYLEQTLYPILREAALFLLDWVVEEDGGYTTCPSTSPENRFLTADGTACCIASASAMDLTLIRELWDHFEKVCTLLQKEDVLLEEIRKKRARLRPVSIGSQGQILEWDKEYPEAEPGHRHLSHLYGLFPSELWENEQGLKDACRISLKHRLEHGGGHTGWSCAWIINLFAVLGDGEQAYAYLNTLLTRSTYDNLWDAHPPFQIDGNFGGIAGIANMLVQDRGGEVKILPALPKVWRNGWVKGLGIKGGKTIDIVWEDGKVKKTVFHNVKTIEKIG